MITISRPRTEPRLLGWIGWAGLDAIGRLAMLTACTAALSRLLTPHDFGVSALSLTFVAVAAVFVGMPFEEPLAQRRSLRMIHLQAALGASWLIACVILLISVGVGWALARAYGEPELIALLPVSTLSIFFTGQIAILIALARRHRRFNEVARASLFGNAIGIVLSLAVAFLGGGVWALVANRLLIAAATALILQWRLGFLVTPRWAPAQIGGFGRFAGVSFLDQLTDGLTYLIFNNVVEVIYGASVLGYVNMAMRVIEPIRGAIAATGHNLSFSFFARASNDPAKLDHMARQIVSQSALTVAPIFVGMAAVTPVLLPLIAGPGWDEAIGISIGLAIGCALALPPRLIYTALSASAEPEYSLFATLAGFAVTMLLLVAFSAAGPISVGLARVGGDGMRALIAIGLTSKRLTWSRRGRLAALLPAWSLSAAMGLVVANAERLLPQMSRLSNSRC